MPGLTGARAFPLAAALLLAAGCASEASPADRGAASSTTAAAATAEEAAPVGEGDCAWAVKADQATLNIAYPDTSATYWAVSYDLAPGEHLELAGTFPDARYASFITYGRNGGPIDVLTDRDIAPDDGATNPFAESGADGGTYTVSVGAEPDPDDPNALDAATDAAVEERPTSTPEGIRLGSGGDDATSGTTLYRVYLPADEADALGGGGLPDVALVDADGTRTEIPTCAEPGASERARELVETYGPETSAATPEEPVFLRPGRDAATLYPNPDNVYIATIAEHEAGRILVIRGRAPEVGRQLRYWSVCTDEYRKPYPVSACVADPDITVDDDGRYTIVVSTPEDRPANATADDGATWLDWGATDERNLVLVRHMLAEPDFAESATNVAPLALATSSMGEYAPVGSFCTTAAFETDPDAC